MEEKSGFEWYNFTATEEEKQLSDRVSQLSEEYFSDMLFRGDSITGQLMKVTAATAAGEQEWMLDADDELEYFDYSAFGFKVEPLEDGKGCFNGETQELCISPEYLDDDSVILHEMIHLHEFVLDRLLGSYHDMALWALYTDLREKIPNLDSIISASMQMLVTSTIERRGGAHNLLFLLKSFDLDIRIGQPLGTVFGYGKAEEIQSLIGKEESA